MNYRLPELEINEADPFRHDVLNRKPLVEFLSALIDRLSGPFVLALDSPWGTGKTTLVRMLKAKLEQEKFQCIYFNAWQVDYVTDPLVALVSAIDDIQLTDANAESAFRGHMKTAKKITSVVAKRVVIAGVKAATFGVLDIEDEIEKVTAEATGEIAGNLVDSFQKEKRALDKFRSEVKKAVEQLKASEKKDRLVFFIDELDRCRPTFAIEMLERIKHLFDVPNIIFVLSIDKTQLEASTAAVYGEKINATEYLRRFIDLEYGIPVVQTKKFTANLLTRFDLDSVFASRIGSELQYDKSNFIEFFTLLADIFTLSLRARERCITRLAVIMDQTPSNHYLDPIMIALLVVLRSNEPKIFAAICRGILSPAEIMKTLLRLPGGDKLVADRPGILIESYLMVGDGNRDRTEARYKELEVISKNDAALPSEQSRAQDMLHMRGRIFTGYRSYFALNAIVEKIDFVAMIKD
jgi:ABC-type dipeptide/oligopeptide/nickel transport system ATPase subunit